MYENVAILAVIRSLLSSRTDASRAAKISGVLDKRRAADEAVLLHSFTSLPTLQVKRGRNTFG